MEIHYDSDSTESFPAFFDSHQLVIDATLEPILSPAILYSDEVCKRVILTCQYEKYFPATQVVQRFFISSESIIGCQFVFFDEHTSLTAFEAVELRALSFRELVTSLDKAVLLKIALVWKYGVEKDPVMYLFSKTISNANLHFLSFSLQSLASLD